MIENVVSMQEKEIRWGRLGKRKWVGPVPTLDIRNIIALATLPGDNYAGPSAALQLIMNCGARSSD
jgi:hypothetical protein